MPGRSWWHCRSCGAVTVWRRFTGENAEPVPGPTTDFLSGLALEFGVWLLGGSILEGEPGAERLSNTSTCFDPSGELAAIYRKIHLFDANVQYQIHKLSLA